MGVSHYKSLSIFRVFQFQVTWSCGALYQSFCKGFVVAEAHLVQLQVLYLRLVYIFCQRMLAPGWGVLPHAVWGFKAYWQSLYLYPGVVITATIMVSRLSILACAVHAATRLQWAYLESTVLTCSDSGFANAVLVWG